MKKYDLSIIIVTFNSENQIEKCLDSIAKSESKYIKIKVNLIDNNSKDKTVSIVKKLQEKFKAITLIENKENIGFARAVNQGINASLDSEYILLLNPDTELEKNSLTNLLYCCEKNNAGICGGSTVDKQGTVSGSYFRFPNIMVGIFDFTNLRKLDQSDRWHKYFYYTDTKNKDKECFPVDVVTGGYMLIKKDTIKKVGVLDESYFMYLEDVDYCYRVKKAGIKIYHTNNSRIFHVGGASSNNKDRVRHSSWLKSRKIYFMKHFNLLENLLIQPIFLIDDLLILFKMKFKI